MADKELVAWLRSAEAQGYSEDELKKLLKKQGYSQKDIDDAASLIRQKSTKSFDFRLFLKPSFLKLALPILILVLLTISFYDNSTHIPPLVESNCQHLLTSEQFSAESTRLNEKIQSLRWKFNADPEIVVDLFKQNALQRQKTTQTLNELGHQRIAHFMILGRDMFLSPIQKLNPFFPTPCEISAPGFTFVYGAKQDSTLRCRYYSTQEEYNCIVSQVGKSPEYGELGISGSYLVTEIPRYAKIGIVDYFANALLLVLIVYLLLCILSLIIKRLQEKSTPLKVFVVLALLVLPILLPAITNNLNIYFTYPAILLFSVLLFVGEKTQKRILYASFIGLIVLLVGAILVTQHFISTTTATVREKSRALETPITIESKIFPCTNTKNAEEEKQAYLHGPPSERPPAEYLAEEWILCDNPSCSEMCMTYARGISSGEWRSEIAPLRGDNPSCVCVVVD